MDRGSLGSVQQETLHQHHPMRYLVGGLAGRQMPLKDRIKPNAWDIITKALSYRWWALATLFIILDTAAPFLQGMVGAPDWAFGLASGVCAVGGLIARIWVQDNLRGEP